MRLKQAVILFLLGLLAGQLASAETKPAKQIAVMLAHFQTKDAPGLAVLVLKDGKQVYAGGFGVEELRSKTSITPKTNFRIASLTKQFTAAAILLLVHDGKLHLDDTLASVFPEFPPYGRNITIRNLLNHTSGLQDYGPLMQKKYAGLPMDQIPQLHDKDVLALMEQQPGTIFPPGSQWEYSNAGYAVLAMVVERVSSMSFQSFLAQRIFKPLKMKRTVAFVKGENEVSDRAYGHSRAKDEWKETDQSPASAILGDGGIYSSLEDLRKWNDALDHHRLLSVAEMEPEFTPVRLPNHAKPNLPDGSEADYGFGWFLRSYDGRDAQYHSGVTIGFKSAYWRFPQDHLAIIVLCNRMDIDPQGITLDIADLFLLPEKSQPVPAQPPTTK